MSVCLSVTLLWPQFLVNFDETLHRSLVWNPKSNIEFVRNSKSDHFLPLFSPIFHRHKSQWQGLSITGWKHVDRLWRLIAQKTLLCGRCTGDRMFNDVLRTVLVIIGLLSSANSIVVEYSMTSCIQFWL